MKATLTKTQERVLEFIKEYKDKHGCMPTYQECADGLGVKIPSVYCVIKRIAAKGFIQQDHRARMMKLL